MSPSCFARVCLLFLSLSALSASAHETLVSLDIDGVILYKVNRRDLCSAVPEALIPDLRGSRSSSGCYVKTHLLELFLLGLRAQNAVKVGFFSAQHEERNLRVLSQIRVGPALTALDLAENRVLSSQHTKRDPYDPHGYQRIKPLSLFSHPVDSVIHVDDNPHVSAHPGEYPNLLRVLGSAHWPFHHDFLSEDFRVTETIDRYKLVRVLGIIRETLRLARASSLSTTQALQTLTAPQGRYEPATSHASPFYQLGLETMEQVLPQAENPCAQGLFLERARRELFSAAN